MDNIISRRLNGVHFSYYTSQEIRNLSVKEITNPIAFDNLGRALNNGLYDPGMGVSPYDRLSRCITCGQEGMDCPGHCGHVELLLPVYNPFLVERLLRLIRSKCLNPSCHRLRIPREKLIQFYYIFTLIKLGYVTEAQEYKSIVESKIYRRYVAMKSNEKKQSDKDISSRKTSESTQAPRSRLGSDTTTSETQQSQNNNKNSKMEIEDINDEFLQKILKQKKQIQSLINVKKNKQEFESGVKVTNNMNAAFEDLQKELWGSVVASGNCPHCKKKTGSSIRKEGCSKFFIYTKDESKTTMKLAKKHHQKDKNDDETNQQNSDSDMEEESKFEKGFLEVDSQENEEPSKKQKQKYLNPVEIREHVRAVWKIEKKLLDLIFGSILVNQKTLKHKDNGYRILTNGPEMFFLETILVTPNRFRPENKLGDMTFLHGHTVELTKLIQLNQELRNMIVLQRMDEEDPKTKQIKKFLDQTGYYQLKENEEVQKTVNRVTKLSDVMTKWLAIQESVTCFLDTSKAQKTQDKEGTGIKQILEKKEGLFRMKMMGKRVNFGARSVISPDPNLNTNEVGVPLFMAKKLTFPEYVNEYNVKMLRERIIRGPFEHPGAVYVMDKDKKIMLEMLDEQQRTAIANTLMNNPQDKVVYRHLQSGDVLLFNRQPTLHKPSLMSHIARVLPKEQTIRMHYANCKSYNADFDGDEMNLHFLQSHLARSEAYQLSLNDNNYISATNGKPLRELMQDSIVSAVFMTIRGNFYEKAEYQELLYTSTFNLVTSSHKQTKLFLLPPAIKRPKELWTGKQLLSNIIKLIVDLNGHGNIKGLSMKSKAKLSKAELPGTLAEETDFIVSDNEIVQGILDKNQVGSGADYGLMHAFHELYGPKMLGQLFTAFAKVLSCNLQQHGFTCGLDDLLVNTKQNEERMKNLQKTHENSITAVIEKFEMKTKVKPTWNLFNRSDYKYSKGKYNKHILKRTPEQDYISTENDIVKEIQRRSLADDTTNDQLDMIYKAKNSKGGSAVIKDTLGGLEKPFPYNCFTTMTRSGAKGSMVNHSQVSALLGQQELEGKRVPLMANGKSLPCFLAYDPNPRAGGFIGDRFLSGLRPPEFYFHCMAGREGLIDTAVKTSRSGYLQRCLMKHLESLKISYDYSVRDADQSIIQFYYGEDSIDPTKTKYLEDFSFLSNNFTAFSHKYDPFGLKGAIDGNTVAKYTKNRKKAPQEKQYSQQTIQNVYNPGRYLGAVSEKMHDNVKGYVKKEEQKDENIFNKEDSTIKPSKFRMLANIKYLHSLVNPGEGVGCMAAMGIGEPSTQMTLNTFHLAGHGGANLTLGIPRLREILMTASEKIATPIMTLQFSNSKISKEKAEKYARKLKKINLIELIKKITVIETKRLVNEATNKVLAPQLRGKIYKIDIEYEDPEAIKHAFGISQEQIQKRVEQVFLPNLVQYIEREKKKNQGSDLNLKVVKKMKEGQEGEEDEDIDKNFEQNTVEETLNFESTTQQGTTTTQDVTQDSSKSQVQQKAKKEKGKLISSEYLESVEHDTEEGSSSIVLKLPLDFKKILMVNVVNKLLANTIVREIKGIQNTAVLKNENNDSYYIQTEGVNFNMLSELQFIDANKCDSNDLWKILRTYGVEAARAAIIREVSAVFSVYGVKNDPRHMSLISDFMTFGGKIRGMNRGCIEENVSPFLKMSYETCGRFLTNAALYNTSDDMQTPSAQIVLGQVPTVGTGAFEIMHNLKK